MKQFPKDYDEAELEEDLANANYEKQYNKFIVRDHKLKKRRSTDWELHD
jgi:hypothetical protein